MEIKNNKFKKTLTYLFLYPLLRDVIPVTKSNIVVNAFLYDKAIPLYKYKFEQGKIINQKLTIATLNNRDLQTIEYKEKLRNSDSYVQSYQSSDGLLEFYVIEFPKVYENIYYHFLHGNYSQFSEVSKKIIVDFHKGSKVFNIVDGTLYKREALRKSWEEKEELIIPIAEEYWYKPVLEYKDYTVLPTGEVLTEQIKELLVQNETIKT